MKYLHRQNREKEMNEYKVIISKEYIYELTIFADNWEEACDKAEHKFEVKGHEMKEVESQWEVMDYELMSGEEPSIK